MAESADVIADYAEAGFAQRLGFGRTPALLVVDFVNAYLTPGNLLYAGVEDALHAATALLAAARAARIPVIYTRVVYTDAGRDGGMFFVKARALAQFVGATEAGEIARPLRPQADELVIHKQFASAFFGTDLHETLQRASIDTVLIAGLSTSGCVRATAVDAVQYGYRPMVVREAVGDRREGPHLASLFDLDAKYADVVGLTEVSDYLRQVGR